MPQVRCPLCGATNSTRALDYPFCVGCQENLAKCGYCQWFEDRAGVCTHSLVAGAFEVSPEATPPCGYHAPRDSMAVKRGSQLRSLVPALAVGLVVLAYGLFRLLQPTAPTTPPPPPPGELRLAVEVDYEGAAVGESYTLMAEIYNASDAVVSEVRFEIAKEFLDQFELLAIVPRPDRTRVSGQWQTFCYPAVHPRERRTIRLELEPKTAGTFHLIAHLVSGEGAYHGMTDLPVVVKEADADVAEGEEGSVSDATR